MVLAELGQRISRALGSLNSVTVVDEAVRLPPVCRCCSSLLPCCLPAEQRRALLHHDGEDTNADEAWPELAASSLSFSGCTQVLDACLKEIATALLQADVNVRLVANLRCGAPGWPVVHCLPSPLATSPDRLFTGWAAGTM